MRRLNVQKILHTVRLATLCLLIASCGVDETSLSSYPHVEEAQCHSWDEEVEFEGVRYRLKSIHFTQDLEGRDRTRVNYLTDEVADDGSFTGNTWFAWIKLRAENVSAEQVEALVNSYYLTALYKQHEVSEGVTEGVYIDPVQSEEPEMVFHVILEPGEKREMEIGLMFEPDELGDMKDVARLNYCIGIPGAQHNDPENTQNQFLDVEEFWDAR